MNAMLIGVGLNIILARFLFSVLKWGCRELQLQLCFPGIASTCFCNITSKERSYEIQIRKFETEYANYSRNWAIVLDLL